MLYNVTLFNIILETLIHNVLEHGFKAKCACYLLNVVFWSAAFKHISRLVFLGLY